MATRDAGCGERAVVRRRDLVARLSGAGPPVLLDGALGTELERLGVEASPPLWSAQALLTAPEQISAIHRGYLEAGAEMITANTFRTQRRTLARGAVPGLAERDRELTERAVDLARQAVLAGGYDVWIAGSAPPLEDCYVPELVPVRSALDREQMRHAENLAAAGVDLILAETMNTIREACATLVAGRAVGLPVIASFVCGPGATLLSGEPLAEALRAVLALEPVAVGVNCMPPDDVEACLPVLRASGIPFGVYANLGAPGETPHAPRQAHRTPEQFARHVQSWIAAGARFVGGCCGTTSAHIAAIHL